MAHQYSRVGFKSSVEVNEVNLSLSYGGVAIRHQLRRSYDHLSYDFRRVSLELGVPSTVYGEMVIGQ